MKAWGDIFWERGQDGFHLSHSRFYSEEILNFVRDFCIAEDLLLSLDAGNRCNQKPFFQRSYRQTILLYFFNEGSSPGEKKPLFSWYFSWNSYVLHFIRKEYLSAIETFRHAFQNLKEIWHIRYEICKIQSCGLRVKILWLMFERNRKR